MHHEEMAKHFGVYSHLDGAALVCCHFQDCLRPYHERDLVLIRLAPRAPDQAERILKLLADAGLLMQQAEPPARSEKRERS